MKQNLTVIKTAIFATAIFLLTACNNYQKTPSGLAYKITNSGTGKSTIKPGEWVELNIEYKLGSKDTVLFTTFKKVPQFIEYDTTRAFKHDFPEILSKLKEGGKAEFVMSVDTLVKLSQIPAYNQMFKKGGTIKGRLEIVKVYPNKAAAQANMDAAMSKAREIQMKEMQEQMKKEKDAREKEAKEYLAKNKPLLDKQVAELKAYATAHNLVTTQLPSGVLVETINAGTGSKPTNGNTSKVMYKGYLVNGKVFDTNMNDTAKIKNPIDVIIGSGNTIPGFEEGVQQFAKGSKGKILIPAVLAYRDKDNGPIPANSNIIFDIEVVDIVAGDKH